MNVAFHRVMVRRLLGLLLIPFLWAYIGCLELDRDGTGTDDNPWPSDVEPNSWIEVNDLSERGPVVASPEDVAVCRAQADLQRRCAADVEAPLDVSACAEQLACSRRLWRTDVPAVYRCLSDRPCDDLDPVMSCLSAVADEVEPSEAEQTFDLELAEAQLECAELVEVAPRQADVIYDALTFCITENDECDVKAACIQAMLTALVDEVCGES